MKFKKKFDFNFNNILSKKYNKKQTKIVKKILLNSYICIYNIFSSKSRLYGDEHYKKWEKFCDKSAGRVSQEKVN